MLDKVRLSLGTAIMLELDSGIFPNVLSTGFIMTYTKDKCLANCAFCPQARESHGRADMLSRITWPVFDFSLVLRAIQVHHSKFTRFCIQTINYHNVISDTVEIVANLRKITRKPISVAIHAIEPKEMKLIKNAGATNISIPLDGANKDVFEKIKGASTGSPYRWETHNKAIDDALKIFGINNVSTHVIVGLGETEEDVIRLIDRMYRKGVRVALFAFTPIKGTALENVSQPDLGSYRRIQLMRYLLERKLITIDDIFFNDGKIENVNIKLDELYHALKVGQPFRVSGCPGCNRPYYDERPLGPMYNYHRPLTKDEINKAIDELNLKVNGDLIGKVSFNSIFSK